MSFDPLFLLLDEKMGKEDEPCFEATGSISRYRTALNSLLQMISASILVAEAILALALFFRLS